MKRKPEKFGDVLRRRQTELTLGVVEFQPQSVGYQDVAALVKSTITNKLGDSSLGNWWKNYIADRYTTALSEQDTSEIEDIASEILENYQELDAKSISKNSASQGSKIVDFFSRALFQESEHAIDEYHLSGSYSGGIENKNIVAVKPVLEAYGYSEDNSKYSTSSEIASTLTGLINPNRMGGSEWNKLMRDYVELFNKAVKSLDTLFDSCYNLDSENMSNNYTVVMQNITDMRALLVEIEQKYVTQRVSDFNELYAEYRRSIPDDYMYVAYGREPVEAAAAESKRDYNKCKSDFVRRLDSARAVAQSHYRGAVIDANEKIYKVISKFNADNPNQTPVNFNDYQLNVDSGVLGTIASAFNNMKGMASQPCSAVRSAMYSYYIQKYQKSGLWGVAERNVIRNVGGDAIYTQMTKAEARPLLDAEHIRLINLLNQTRNDATEVQEYIDYDFPRRVDLINEGYADAINHASVMVSGAIDTQLYTRGNNYTGKHIQHVWDEKQTNVDGGNYVIEEMRGYYTMAQSDFLKSLRGLGMKYAAITNARLNLDASYATYDSLDKDLEAISKNTDSVVSSVMRPSEMNSEIWGGFE